MLLSEMKIIAAHINELNDKLVIVNLNTLFMGKQLTSQQFQT